MDRNPKIRTPVAVVGAGAIGGVYAWALHKAGHDVSLCVRTRFDELVVETGDGTERIPVRVVTDPGGLKPMPWVLLAVKAYDTDGALPWLSALCDENTTVVVLQNGVDGVGHVRDLVPASTVLPALVYTHAERLAPGHIRLGYPEDIEVPAGPQARRLAELFEGSGMRIRAQEDMLTVAWRKLMLNAAMNPLTALTLRRQEVVREPGIRALAEQLIRETAKVGVAVGAHLTEQDVQRTIAFLPEDAEGNGSSMLYDRLAARPLEYEALNGAVVRYAEEHGIDVPMNRAITALLAALRPLDAAGSTAAA